MVPLAQIFSNIATPLVVVSLISPELLQCPVAPGGQQFVAVISASSMLSLQEVKRVSASCFPQAAIVCLLSWDECCDLFISMNDVSVLRRELRAASVLRDSSTMLMFTIGDDKRLVCSRCSHCVGVRVRPPDRILHEIDFRVEVRNKPGIFELERAQGNGELVAKGGIEKKLSEMVLSSINASYTIGTRPYRGFCRQPANGTCGGSLDAVTERRALMAVSGIKTGIFNVYLYVTTSRFIYMQFAVMALKLHRRNYSVGYILAKVDKWSIAVFCLLAFAVSAISNYDRKRPFHMLFSIETFKRLGPLTLLLLQTTVRIGPLVRSPIVTMWVLGCFILTLNMSSFIVSLFADPGYGPLFFTVRKMVEHSLASGDHIVISPSLRKLFLTKNITDPSNQRLHEILVPQRNGTIVVNEIFDNEFHSFHETDVLQMGLKQLGKEKAREIILLRDHSFESTWWNVWALQKGCYLTKIVDKKISYLHELGIMTRLLKEHDLDMPVAVKYKKKVMQVTPKDVHSALYLIGIQSIVSAVVVTLESLYYRLRN